MSEQLYFQQPGNFNVPDYYWKWTMSEFDQWAVYTMTAPCWFHRLMQRMILGIKWEKL